jgi:glycosyltransferase involved in cell wall biosynthesis
MSSPRVRVLLIGPALNILGGQAVQVKHLLANLGQEPSITIDFQAFGPELPRPFRFLQGVYLLRTVLNLALYTVQLSFRVWRYDLVHVFSAGYTSYCLWTLPALFFAKLYRKKIVLHYHDGQGDDHLRRWRTAIPTIRMMDAVVAPSGFLVDVFARFGLRIRTISNTLAAEEFHYRPRSRLRPVVLHNRIMEPLYNIPCSMRAFQIVQQHYPEASLTLAHNGPSLGELEALAQELKLRNTKFIGRVPHERVAELYDSADLYFTSPDFDNMPGSILECFASGLPVVATATGGIPYIATNEETALLIPTGDHQAMAQAALRLLEDPALVERLTANARASCVRYTSGPVREQWTRLYHDVMKGDRTLRADGGA